MKAFVENAIPSLVENILVMYVQPTLASCLLAICTFNTFGTSCFEPKQWTLVACDHLVVYHINFMGHLKIVGLLAYS